MNAYKLTVLLSVPLHCGELSSLPLRWATATCMGMQKSFFILSEFVTESDYSEF